MADRGKKRTPLALVKQRGTKGNKAASKDAENAPEPDVLEKVPTPPSFLTAKEKKVFKEFATLLHEAGVLTGMDVDVLSGLSKCWQQWIDASKALEKGGLTFTSYNRNGDAMERKRPEIGIANDAWKMVMSILTEYGMTPASRSKVSLAGKGNGNKGGDGWSDL